MPGLEQDLQSLLEELQRRLDRFRDAMNSLIGSAALVSLLVFLLWLLQSAAAVQEPLDTIVARIKGAVVL
jgi:hypothetical protein